MDKSEALAIKLSLLEAPLGMQVKGFNFFVGFSNSFPDFPFGVLFCVGVVIFCIRSKKLGIIRHLGFCKRVFGKHFCKRLCCKQRMMKHQISEGLVMASNTMLQAEIKEDRIERGCIEVVYPIIGGLPSKEVQTAINEEILNTVNTMMPSEIQCDREGDFVSGTYRIRLNQQGLLSLTMFVQWFFFPMAHPAENYRGITVDLATGEIYSFGDLFRGGSRYQILIDRFIEEEIARRGITTIAPYPGVNAMQDYYLTPDALVVFFPIYEFTPRPEGFPEFVIPYTYIRNRIDPKGPLARLV